MSRFSIRAAFLATVPLLALAGLPGAAHADLFTIDDFSTADLASPQYGPGTGQPNSPASLNSTNASIAGGFRKLEITQTGGGAFDLGNTGQIAAGTFQFASGPFPSASVSAQLAYGTGFGGSALGSLIFGGLEAFQFNFLDVVAPGVEMDITITVTDNNSSDTQAFQVPEGPNVFFAPFSAFSGIDFTQVESVEVIFNSSLETGVDFTLGNFGVFFIPEPLSIAAWGVVGVAGIWITRRRRAVLVA